MELLCVGDKELISFKFVRGSLKTAEFISRELLPFEFDGLERVTEKSLIDWFDARITPETRIGIHEALAQTPIEYYHPERMIRYGDGKCTHDWCWVKCDDDRTCWE